MICASFGGTLANTALMSSQRYHSDLPKLLSRSGYGQVMYTVYCCKLHVMSTTPSNVYTWTYQPAHLGNAFHAKGGRRDQTLYADPPPPCWNLAGKSRTMGAKGCNMGSNAERGVPGGVPAGVPSQKGGSSKVPAEGSSAHRGSSKGFQQGFQHLCFTIVPLHFSPDAFVGPLGRLDQGCRGCRGHSGLCRPRWLGLH